MREEFDFDVALAALQDGQGLTGKDGILTPLVKQLTEAALNRGRPRQERSCRKTINRLGLDRLSRTGEKTRPPSDCKIISMFGLGMAICIAGHISDYGRDKRHDQPGSLPEIKLWAG